VERVRHWQRTVRHELFEYEGRISQLVRTVEMDVPQAIGVLHKIVRRLEVYQALRTNDPSGAYNDFALVQELWPAAAPGESAVGREDASDGIAITDAEDESAGELKG
jgi:hypothetical protein